MIFKQFKIYPDVHWIYFDVFIHHDKRAFLKAIGDPPTSGCLGICKSFHTVYITDGRARKWHMLTKGKIGEIHLMKRECGMRIVTHEIAHAAHRYIQLRENSNAGPLLLHYPNRNGYADIKEETFCWVMGEMVRQFVLSYHHPGSRVLYRLKTISPILPGTNVKEF